MSTLVQPWCDKGEHRALRIEGGAVQEQDEVLYGKGDTVGWRSTASNGVRVLGPWLHHLLSRATALCEPCSSAQRCSREVCAVVKKCLLLSLL